MDSIKPLTMRSGPLLGRTSTAIQTVNGEPYKLWSVYKNGDKTILATCNSVDTLPAAWTIQDVIGENLLDATIVFNSEYVWKTTRWVMYTEDTPWIFYVTSTGSLMGGKHGGEFEELATGVTNVAAIRGWKNPTFIEKDQGIIVAYVKNATIYYRSYCIQEAGNTIWETEKSLAHKAGSVTRVSLVSLNDYRIGFSVEDTSGNISWTLTHRNWAGMAVTPEKITCLPQCTVSNTKITYKQGYSDEKLTITPSASMSLLYGNTNISLISVGNVNNGSGDWGWYIDFSISHSIINTPAIVLTDLAASTQIAIDHIEQIDEHTYRVIVSASWEFGINDVEGNIRVDVSGMIVESQDMCPAIYGEFTPVGLVPSAFPLPVVEVIWNE